MNVVIFAPYTRFTPHLETELEIIQCHLDQGDDVSLLMCNGELLTCDINPQHTFRNCMYCIGKRAASMPLLSQKINARSFYDLSAADRAASAAVKTSFASIDELKAYRIDNFEIGYAVLSSLISWTRDPSPDLKANASRVRDLLVSAFAVYRSLQNYLEKHRVDRMYVFNGRHAPLRAAVRACQSRGVEFFTHDKGHDIQHYGLFENTTPHDRSYIEYQIREHWARAVDDPRREQVAAEFFLDREGGVTRSWRSFITQQRAGLLPAGWNPGEKNVVIFSSSEDEFAALDDSWKSPLYNSQVEGIEAILRSLSTNGKGIRLYLRLHPNLSGISNAYMARVFQLKAEFVTLISPDDAVSTYALLKSADTVLSFGSTVGIEAVFWGKPSILAGQSFYRNLGGTYNPQSHEELIELLKADLKPKARDAALMYGYYMNSYGVPYRHFMATGITEGQFKGKKIEYSRLASIGLGCCDRSWRFERVANAVLRARSRRKLTGKIYSTPPPEPLGTDG
ncbi:MAG: hypothetical protein HY695_05075 [Deltaproteobacteria bacterium]|nr:hypothetical protein [Deltaproteobacteria bacterium]